nr:ribosome-releasing factor 2, mitochondrial isoform X2 [Onthophagus taurus]
MNSHLIKFIRRYKQWTHKYFYSTQVLGSNNVDKIRNIGILAHIDAGKTTTTERMLFFAGSIKQMGEVHDGNTVTDFMSQERERGITIRSAAVTFSWRKHQVNLVDTPGHIDFTMEVEQTLNVLDGAVIVLDGSAGVEAQTVTVWQQSLRYKIPKIVFVNKMDRKDADLMMSCNSLVEKMRVKPVCLQMPLIHDKKFIGVIDVLTMEKLTWEQGKMRRSVIGNDCPKTLQSVKEARAKVVDTVSGCDDELASKIIESESLDNAPTPLVVNAIRRATISEKIIPVFCGSAYKNIGIEPLLDAVIMYLPSPKETKQYFQHFGENLCARAFKIVHDKQRGPVTFFRIYSGNFSKGQKTYNIQKNLTEQTGKVMVTFADEYKEVESLGVGNIAAITGLKHSTTGDMITSSATAAQAAKKLMGSKDGSVDINDMFSKGPKVPEAVFFCSVEPPSLSQQAALETALTQLQREDPSLRVNHDPDTNQIILGGMGELHLEIIKDRLLKEYKVEATLGKLQISYREAPLDKATCDITTETKIGNNKHFVSISLSIIPKQNEDDEKVILILDRTSEAASNIACILPKHLVAVRHGIIVGLMHGPKIGYQVMNCQIMLHMLNVVKGTTDFAIEATATQCVQKLLKQAKTSILEPIMLLEIICQEAHVPSIMGDLSKKRAAIRNVSIRSCGSKVITSEVPLSELFGYSTSLRIITSGTATFTMEFLEYRALSLIEENKVIEKIRGF